MKQGFELDQDQLDAVEFGLRNPYSIISLDMGKGKTPTALEIAHRLKKPCLIICPSYLTLNWEKEIHKFYSDKIVTRFKTHKEVFFPVDSDFIIASYEIGLKEELFEWAKIVVFDESTELKALSAKRTKLAHKLIFENSVPRVYFLTGTPILNRIGEFYSMIAMCNYNPRLKDPPFLKTFPDNATFSDKFSYREEFEIYRGGKRVKILKWTGAKNIGELKTWLRGIYIRRKAKDTDTLRNIITLDNFPCEELALAFKDYDNVSKVAPNVKAEAALRKVPLTCKYVSGLKESGEIEGPIIIYTDHRESCKALAEYFKVEPITGEMPVSKRQKISEDFQAGKLEYLVATIGSFSTGVTLTKSNYIAVNDPCWTPGGLKQMEYRIIRKGQTRQCRIDYIVGSEQDEYIYKKLEEKKETIEKVF